MPVSPGVKPSPTRDVRYVVKSLTVARGFQRRGLDAAAIPLLACTPLSSNMILQSNNEVFHRLDALVECKNVIFGYWFRATIF